MEALLNPEVINVIIIKSLESGVNLSKEQVEAVIKACIWMKSSLEAGESLGT
jgi:hypothetical protein